MYSFSMFVIEPLLVAAIYSTVVELLPMVRWITGSIPHDEPTELFLVITSAPHTVLTKAVVCDMLSDGAYKRTLAVNRKRIANAVAAAGFFSNYLSGPLPYNRK